MNNIKNTALDYLVKNNIISNYEYSKDKYKNDLLTITFHTQDQLVIDSWDEACPQEPTNMGFKIITEDGDLIE